MRKSWPVVMSVAVSGTLISAALAVDEAKKVVDRLLAPPTIKTESSFTAKVLVPPGQLYDPLFMVPRGAGVWLNDDGGEEQDKGSRLLSIDGRGKVSVLAGIGKLVPVTGLDVAPEGFGEYGGQIFTLAQAKVKMDGALANHVVQRVDPKREHAASVFCTLPAAGDVNKGIAGAGIEARFGPEGSPFAGKFYSVTAYNNTIYRTTADGQCTPFVTFDNERFGAPLGLTFAPDGQTMLVTVTREGLFTPAKGSAIVRVSPEGKVEDKPIVEGKTALGGLGFAPDGFGAYSGQLFVTELGSFQIPVPMTQALEADGKVYRVTPEGEMKLVASGFVNPIGLRFVGHELWVTDINGDFIGGGRELPDGFVVKITAQ